MNAPDRPAQSEEFLAETHEIVNVSRELVDNNLYLQDAALQEAVRREGAGWAHDDLVAFGALAGSAEHLALGVLANRFGPELETHDRFGNRIDQVTFHPAYHALMKTSIEHGLHASPWTDPGAGRARRARRAFVPAHPGRRRPRLPDHDDLRRGAVAAHDARSSPRAGSRSITARVYDPRNVPDGAKGGLTIGMAMTEKQGGSDVRANTTRAYPIGAGGTGEAYELVGHKYFVSAPMCDAFLVLAQAPGGLSCFLLPRWRPDGSKNPLQLLRLKRKMGNVSNASSETELRGALAWMVGEEGRGVRTIIEMVAMTRFDCMVGSSAGQRAGGSAGAASLRDPRRVRAACSTEQPLMTNVLADLVARERGARSR